MENEIGKKGSRIKHVMSVDQAVSAFAYELTRPKYKGCSIVGTFAVVFNPRGLNAKAPEEEDVGYPVSKDASEDDDE